MRKRPDPEQVAGPTFWDGGFFGFRPWGDPNAQRAPTQRAGQSYYPSQQRTW